MRIYAFLSIHDKLVGLISVIFSGSVSFPRFPYQWLSTCIVDLPTSRARNFLERKARAKIFYYVFGVAKRARERELNVRAGAYYRKRKREAKDFEKVYLHYSLVDKQKNNRKP